MRKLIAGYVTLAGFLFSFINPIPAVAVGNSIYVAATGTVGAGSSCASPGYVGGASIATAVGAAADGDTIILCNGTFNVSSQIFINNKELTISGQTSAANTIINGSSSSNGILKIISQKSVKIEKITFYQGYNTSFGGAIYMSMRPSQSLSTTRHIITNNYFVQNKSDDQGGAIWGEGDNMGAGDFQGILTISNNTFVENYAGVDGGAIVMAAVAFDTSKIIIDANKFLYNRAGVRAAGAVVSNFNQLTLTDNIYYMNSSGDTGNAQTLYGGFKIGGDIIMNTLPSGYKDCIVNDLSPTITRTTKVDNPYCQFFDGTQVPGLTSITRAVGLALTGTFIPQSPSVSSSTQGASTATLTLGSRDSGGATITHYSYSLNGGSYVNFPAGNSNTQTITGLNSGTSYSVKLKATSSTGTSYESTSYSFTTGALPADAPIISSVAGGNLSLTVTFTLGADNGNATTDVLYSLNSGSYISTGGVASPIVITSLTGRTSYSVRLKSQNAAGFSSESNLLSATTTDSAQDASDVAAAKEAQRVAEQERARKISEARERVLAAVRAGKSPIKADLLEADYQAVVETTVDSMIVNIPVFARGESTTAEDLVTASKAVNVIQKLSDEATAKRVTTSDLADVGIDAFSTNFKVRILLGLVAAPIDQKDSISEINAIAEGLLLKFQERKNKIIAIGLRISSSSRSKQ
jgi:hypothetical protein